MNKYFYRVSCYKMKITESKLRRIIRESLILERYEYDAYTHQDVINAVDRAFEVLDIQHPLLRQLMIRIARTESGGSPDAVWAASQPEGTDLIVGHDPDPFQLDPSATGGVQTNVNMDDWREFFDERRDAGAVSMGPLTDQSHQEIEQNIVMGAIFSTLYVIWGLRHLNDQANYNPANRNTLNVPQGLLSQREFWKEHYNTSAGAGDLQDFIDKNIDGSHYGADEEE